MDPEFSVNPHLDSMNILSNDNSLLDFEKNVQSKNNNNKNPLQIPELLTTILNNLEVTELIPLRLISVQWKCVIESICNHKVHRLVLYYFEGNIDAKLANRFFGQAKNSQHSVALKFKFNEPFFRFCGGLFPNVDQLVVRKTFSTPDNVHEMLQKYFPNVTAYSLGGQQFCSPSHVTTSHCPITWPLKRLDLDLNLHDQLIPTSALFDQLEHFSSFQYRNSVTLDQLPPLGPKCTHFWFRCDTLTYSVFQRWIERNCNSGSNLAQLTHLGLTWIIDDFDDYSVNRGVFLPLICAKFVSLQMLDLGWAKLALFNRNACVQLAKLTHLRTLRIRGANLDPTSLESVTVPLESIRVLHLMDVDIKGVTTRYRGNVSERFKQNGPIYCRILANVFSNIEELAIYTTKRYFLESFQNNLSHFTRLRHFRKFDTEFDI